MLTHFEVGETYKIKKYARPTFQNRGYQHAKFTVGSMRGNSVFDENGFYVCSAHEYVLCKKQKKVKVFKEGRKYILKSKYVNDFNFSLYILENLTNGEETSFMFVVGKVDSNGDAYLIESKTGNIHCIANAYERYMFKCI